MSDVTERELGVELDRLVDGRRANAVVAWLGCALLVGLGVWRYTVGDIRWGTFVLGLAVLAIIPGPFHRSVSEMLPWELIAIVTAAAAWRGVMPVSELALYLAIAGAGILIAADLHLFTTAQFSHRFVVAVVAIGTAAVGGGWALLSWLSDIYLGTSYISTNAELMGDLIAATVAGPFAGIAFDLYVRWWEARLDWFTPVFDEGGGP